MGAFAIQLAKNFGAYVAATTSTANVDWVKKLGADLVIDYKTEDFETKLKDYDLVIHSNRDSKILEKSFCVLKAGGQLISLVGPPTPEFKISDKIIEFRREKKAKKANSTFRFLFMRTDGNQLGKIASLIESCVINLVIDKIFPFEQTNEAMAYVEIDRVK